MGQIILDNAVPAADPCCITGRKPGHVCVRPPDASLRHPPHPLRAADAMGRAESRPRECRSRLSLRPRRAAEPALSPSFPNFLSRLPRGTVRLALAPLPLAGAAGVAAPVTADVLVSNIGQTKFNDVPFVTVRVPGDDGMLARTQSRLMNHQE